MNNDSQKLFTTESTEYTEKPLELLVCRALFLPLWTLCPLVSKANEWWKDLMNNDSQKLFTTEGTEYTEKPLELLVCRAFVFPPCELCVL